MEKNLIVILNLYLLQRYLRLYHIVLSCVVIEKFYSVQSLKSLM